MALEELNNETAATKAAKDFLMLPTLVLSLIEQVLNQALKLDPSLINKLQIVEHQCLLVEIRDWQQKITIIYANQQLHLNTGTDYSAYDCMISANINTLLALKNPAMLTQLIRQDKLDLQGDLNIAQSYSSAFSSLDIDWPEQLAKHIGDAPAQQLYLHLQSLKQQAKKTKCQFDNTLVSVCQDELAITIHPLELEQFKQQNRALKSQVAAVEQRINALIKAL